MKITAGTTNKAKVQAIYNVFSDMTDGNIITVRVPSNVSEQPFTDEETISGAINRARNALKEAGGDIGIGLEGGVCESPYGLLLCNWGALVRANKIDEPIIAGGARILLPEEIAIRLRNGEELGPVMDDYCQKENIRSNEGAIGIFTNGIVDREKMFTHVVQLLRGQLELKG